MNTFSERQAAYINAIINAGLAPREEVEAAFRGGSQGRAKIDAWGAILRKHNRQARQQARQELAKERRWEPCAYPGCTEQIEVYVHAFGGSEEYPQPARIISLTCEMPGWHEEYRGGKKARVQNTDVRAYRLYACSPQHTEGVFRLTVQLSFAIDEQEEQRLRSIQYPIAVSAEARMQVMTLARERAMEIVAHTGLEEPLAETRAHVQAIARKQLAQLLSEAEQQAGQLTDDLEQFSKHYIRQFVLGYKDGLSVRSHILKKGGESYRTALWEPLYALLEQKNREGQRDRHE